LTEYTENAHEYIDDHLGIEEHIDMVWLRLVGSLKFQVSFAECRLFYRAFLQKRPIILRSLIIEATQ